MDYSKPFVYEARVSSDDRGTFVPWLQEAEALPYAPNLKVKRVYYVYNYGAGVIRGFHFHEREWKIFTVCNGSAKFVSFNPNKPDEKFTFISSSRKPHVVVIPPGFANGWVSLEPQTILLCGSTSSFEESINDDKRMDPYKFGDVWAVKGR